MKRVIQIVVERELVYALTESGEVFVIDNWFQCRRNKWEKLPKIPTTTATEKLKAAREARERGQE